MKLLLALAFAAVVLLAACGGGDDGPAANVDGVWVGTYGSAGTTERTGAVCINIAQDGRDLAGTILFDFTTELPIGGRIANETLSFVWGSGTSSTEPGAPLSFESGGTFSGTASEIRLEGTWTSIDGDSGTWSAATKDTCG